MLKHLGELWAIRKQKKQLVDAYKGFQRQTTSLQDKERRIGIDLIIVEGKIARINDKSRAKRLYEDLLIQKHTLHDKKKALRTEIEENEKWMEKLNDQYKLLTFSKTAQTTAKALNPSTLKNISHHVASMKLNADVSHEMKNDILEELNEPSDVELNDEKIQARKQSIQEAVQLEMDMLEDQEQLKVSDKLFEVDIIKQPAQLLHDPQLEEYKRHLDHQIEQEKREIQLRRQRLTSSSSSFSSRS